VCGVSRGRLTPGYARPASFIVYQIDLTPLQLGPLRLARGFAGYKTPLAGFSITGGGTRPGPSASGIPGRLAAEAVLRARR
jgi:phytoene dehydrogenase-like protein